MDILRLIITASVGYLVGSISFTRIILALKAPGTNVENIQETLPGSKETFTSNSTGSSAVMHQLGANWGGITMLLDMLKAFIPTLVFRLVFPEEYYYFIVAIFTMIGHNYPLYYKFKGGRGLAAMMGGFLAFDPIGIIVCSILGMVLGILSGQVVLIRWIGMFLMIPWAAFFHPGWEPPVYVTIAVGIFWFAMRDELKRFLELSQENKITDQKIVAEFMGMGSVYGLVERFSIPSLIKRIKTKK